MDDWTRSHLIAWIESQYWHLSEESRFKIEQRIVTVYSNDPEYWDRHPWSRCLESAGGTVDIET